jgi:hypothetical protein
MLAQLEEFKIEYVLKEENPLNVQQIRLIESFWANFKKKVYSNNYRPEDVKYLDGKDPLKLWEFVRS